MQLSEWRRIAPNNNCLAQPVLDVLNPALADMGADDDPDCWVNWGDDPEFKFSILAPTIAGLITAAVRLGGPEGPRITTKLVRWSKVQVGEFSIDSSGENRIVAVQVEGLILKGTNDAARRISEFVRFLLAAIEGRAFQPAGQIVVAAGIAGAGVPTAKPAGIAQTAAETAVAPAEREGAAEGPAAVAADGAVEPASGKKAKAPKAPKAQPQPEPAPEEAWVAPHPIPVAATNLPVEADLPITPAPGIPPAPPAAAGPTPAAAAAPPAPATPAQMPPSATPPAAPQPPAQEPVAPRVGPASLPGIPPVPPTSAPVGPREIGSVWEVPAPVDTGQREAPKRPRTWRP